MCNCKSISSYFSILIMSHTHLILIVLNFCSLIVSLWLSGSKYTRETGFVVRGITSTELSSTAGKKIQVPTNPSEKPTAKFILRKNCFDYNDVNPLKHLRDTGSRCLWNRVGVSIQRMKEEAILCLGSHGILPCRIRMRYQR